MSSDTEGEMQPSLTEALAQSLHAIMAMNGKPYRNDPASPGYRADPGLYDQHLQEWRRAQEVLAWFNREQLSK